MLGFGKKAAFKQMEKCVDAIQLAISEAIFAKSKTKDDRERRIVAAVSNLMVGRPSAEHTGEEKRLAMQRAGTIFAANEDIRHAAVMCLRALSVTRGTEFALQAVQTIDWISTFGSIPAQPATYDNMVSLSWSLVRKYCPQLAGE